MGKHVSWLNCSWWNVLFCLHRGFYGWEIVCVCILKCFQFICALPCQHNQVWKKQSTLGINEGVLKRTHCTNVVNELCELYWEKCSFAGTASQL